MTPHGIFRLLPKLSASIANDSQFYTLPDLPGSMRLDAEPKNLLALRIGPDPDFRRFSSSDFEIFVEIAVFAIFAGPQHFSFTFPQRTWMGRVLAYTLALLFLWYGSILDVAPSPVFRTENARKSNFAIDSRPEVVGNLRILRIERPFAPRPRVPVEFRHDPSVNKGS